MCLLPWYVLVLYNPENSVEFICKELFICPNFQHITLPNEERQKTGRRGEENLPYHGMRFQRYLGPLLEKVNVRVGK